MAAPGCEHPRVRVAALIVIEGKVLLVRHVKDDRTYHLLPGGGVERGESLASALVREVSEETGLAIAPGRPLIVNDTLDPAGTRHLVNITFAASVVGGQLAGPSADERIQGVDLVEPTHLTALDLRPPFAEELVKAIEGGDAYQTAYLGPLFTEENHDFT